jgi:nucleoside-diphosphate-sugar epimerase
MAEKPKVLVTGASGSLGLRLLEQLSDFQVIGVVLNGPGTNGKGADANPVSLTTTNFKNTIFEKIDLAEERSCDQLVALLRQYRPESLVHLAFATGPAPDGSPERQRMWHTNVAGTGRVAEAIAEYNRMLGTVEKFIYPSCAAVYGPDLPKPVVETMPLQAETLPHVLPYIKDKKETDLVIQARARGLRQCKTYLLRPHTYTGETARSLLMSVLRGVPEGNGLLAKRLRRKGRRLPVLVPSGPYLERKRQFVHVDDMARLIAHILRRKQADPQISIMNVAGRGEPVLLGECLQIAKAKVRRLPGRALWQQAHGLLSSLGLSTVPSEALPYLLGSQTTDTARLRVFLGNDYRNVIQYTSAEALRISFSEVSPS